MFALLRKTLLLAFLLLSSGAGYALWYAMSPIGLARTPAEFRIEPGSGLRSAARQIEAAGIPLGSLRFELLVRAMGQSQQIKAGSYELPAALSPLALLDKLTRGDVTQAELALIEGWNIRQVRAALDRHPFLRHDTTGLGGEEFLRRVGAEESHPEGLFFPDTYLFAKGSSDLEILRRAYRTQKMHLAREWETRAPGLIYRSAYEALIMASIVEKETGKAADRDMVAGALTNRLRIGMRLQADPTVIYGLGEAFDGNLRRGHLQEDGPYNSYTRAGLPPSPIAMPGLASLRAALHPARTDALYYVARGDGSSQFSRTLDEHNRAVAKYQLKR
jgi:UPF0755 protein